MTETEMIAYMEARIDVTGRRLTTGARHRQVERAIIEELYSREAVKVANIFIPSSQILTLGGTPVPFGLAVPADTIPDIITAKCFREDVNNAYATNTVVAIRSVGADDPIFTLDFLGRTSTGWGGFYMERYTSTNVNSRQVIEGADLEAYVVGGNPTVGTFNMGISLMLAYTPV
jgi:hypothetical protein